ncbi:MAG: hypothetical protein DLM70_01695 [Chloroflexi bacterium]|nr:MAG: hypothetical protein DLM70_01695 [Chloroflexota bacterium]
MKRLLVLAVLALTFAIGPVIGSPLSASASTPAHGHAKVVQKAKKKKTHCKKGYHARKKGKGSKCVKNRKPAKKKHRKHKKHR